MMLAQGYTVAGTARQLWLARNTVQGINQRLTSKEREEWSQQYRTWAEQELLPQVKEYLMDALPFAKPWELNNIIGTVFEKLQALEGRPSEIHAHLTPIGPKSMTWANGSVMPGPFKRVHYLVAKKRQKTGLAGNQTGDQKERHTRDVMDKQN